MSDVERRLQHRGIALPPPPTPLGSYLETFKSGSWLFLSGMLPVVGSQPRFVGRIGADLTVQDGFEASMIACLNGLAAARRALVSLDDVVHVVKLAVYIAATEDFKQHPKVADGASQLLLTAFGPEGLSPRIVLGVASIPLGMAVEVELMLEIKEATA